MANAGYATLSIIPSAKGFKGALNKQVGGSLAAVGTTGGKTAGHHFGAGFLPLVKGFAGPALGLGVGMAIGKGIGAGLKTASFMEQAKISFETLLGSSGAAQKMLSKLSAFAAKTPFELPGITDAARKLIGAGGAAKDVIPTMTALGDASAALGMDQQGLDSVVRAWTQSMGKGKVQAEEMLQMTEAGLPVWSILSRAMGKPVGELQKMATKGKLLAKDTLPLLARQMEKDYGGNMAKQAKTLAGVWSTVKDTVTMALAQALQPLVPILTTVLPPAANMFSTAVLGISSGIQDMVRIAGPPIAAFISKVQSLFKAGQAGSGAFDSLLGIASQLRGTLAPLLPILSAVGTAIVTGLRPIADIVMGSVLPALGALASAIVVGVRPVIAVIGDIITGSLIPAFQDMAAMAAPLFVQLGETIRTVAAQVGPILQGVADVIRTVWGFIGPFVIDIVKGIFQNVVNVFSGILTVISGVVNLVSALFRGDWAAAWAALKQIVSGAVKAVWNLLQLWFLGRVLGIFRGLMTAGKALFRGGWQSMVALVKGAGARIVAFVRGAMDTARLKVMYGMDAIKGFFSRVWNAVVGLVKSAGSRIASSVSSAISRARGFVSSGMARIRAVFSTAWNAAVGLVRNALGRMASAVSGGISKVVGFVRGLGSRIAGAVGNLGGILVGAGRAVLEGFLNGLKSAWGSVTSFVGGIGDWIAAHKGPISYDRKLLIPAGVAIMTGLSDGLRSQLGSLGKTLGTVTDSIVDRVHSRLADGAKGIQRSASLLVPKVPAYDVPALKPGSSVAGAVARLADTATSGVHNEITIQGVHGDPNEFANALTFALKRIGRGGVYAPGGAS